MIIISVHEMTTILTVFDSDHNLLYFVAYTKAQNLLMAVKKCRRRVPNQPPFKTRPTRRTRNSSGDDNIRDLLKWNFQCSNRRTIVEEREEFFQTNNTYTLKTMVHHVMCTNKSCKLQIKKPLHKIPNALRKRFLVRVMYSEMPLHISPKVDTCVVFV